MARSYVVGARGGKGRRKNRAGEVFARLDMKYPDAHIALNFSSEIELLISVMLSAQTTDVMVNRVTQVLFEKYREPEDYLSVPLEELESDIRSIGTFRQKARNLRGSVSILLEEYDGVVPETIEEMVRLPGVGRKTANVVAAERGNPQGIVVDTHVRRLSQRLDLTRKESPVSIEKDLQIVFPKRDWGKLPHLLISHGRLICRARRPRCQECILVDLCPSSSEEFVLKNTK